jgi:hypothetical protein
MLRSPRDEYIFNVTSQQLVNDGQPFLLVICDNVIMSPSEFAAVREVETWTLDGVGNQIRKKSPLQINTRTRAPDSVPAYDGIATGVAQFIVSISIQFHLPRGTFDILFEGQPRVPIPQPQFPRQIQRESNAEIIPEPAEIEEPIVEVSFQRKRNLDLNREDV